MAVAKTLREAYNAVNPLYPLPAGDPRYVDCNSVRGNEDVVDKLYTGITWAEGQTAQLFTGHRGSGKTTELLRLQARLEETGYEVLFFDVDDDLDLNDLDYSDLLLAITLHVISDLTTKGIPLRAPLLKDLENWFSAILYAEENQRDIQHELQVEAALGIGLPETFPLVARLLARVTGQLKTGKTVKEEIRHKLDPHVSRLVGNLNLLLKDAYIQILKRGGRGLVLIIDNLDRVTFRDLGSGRTMPSALYVEHGELLRILDCHIIYTAPLSLLYSRDAAIVTNMFSVHYMSPMLKTHTRDNRPDAEGLAYIYRILAARVDLDLLFKPEAIDILCQNSGGHLRDLMALVRSACIYASDNVWPEPITPDVATRAVGRLGASFSRMIPDEHYPLLAQVYKDKGLKVDALHELMLYNLSVLEYQDDTTWHDVHPVITRLPKFQHALQRSLG